LMNKVMSVSRMKKKVMIAMMIMMTVWFGKLFVVMNVFHARFLYTTHYNFGIRAFLFLTDHILGSKQLTVQIVL
jgi:hypothetical protein